MAAKVEVQDYGASLAEAIIKLSKAIKSTPLTERALGVLLRDLTGVNLTEVMAILRALPRLEQEYLKQAKAK